MWVIGPSVHADSCPLSDDRRERDLLHAPGRRFSRHGRRVRGRGSTAAAAVVDDQEIQGKTTTTAATEPRHPDTALGYNPVTARCHRPEKQNTMIPILFFRCFALHADLADQRVFILKTHTRTSNEFEILITLWSERSAIEFSKNQFF